MFLVCPLRCRFNLPQSRLALYVLAYLMDCYKEGWVRRTVLYDRFWSWVKKQEKGLVSDYRLPYASKDAFYGQLDRLGLQQRKQQWVYYCVPSLEQSDFQLSFHKGQGSPVVSFSFSQRSLGTATRAMTEGVTVAGTTLTEDIEKAAAALELMAQQPKRLSPEALVQKAYDTLLVVLRAGYTYTEIAKVYSRRGIKVTPGQLKLQFEAVQAQKEQAAALELRRLQKLDEQPITEPQPNPQGLLRTKLAQCRETLCLTTEPLQKVVR